MEFLDKEDRWRGKFGTAGRPDGSLHPSARPPLNPIVSEVFSDSEPTPSNVGEMDNQREAIFPAPSCWNWREPSPRWDLYRASHTTGAAARKRAHQFLSSVVLADKRTETYDHIQTSPFGVRMYWAWWTPAPEITSHVKHGTWDSSFHARKGFCYGHVQGIYS